MAVQVDGLRYTYGPRVALQNLSFDVRQGEIFGILGPNGSGKSTFFRMLATLFPPQVGRLRIFGRDVSADRTAVQTAIGVIFQSPSLDKKLTAAENLYHQGHLYGLSGGDLRRRVDDMLSRFGLSDRRDEIVERLSGGLRRRVDLAKGLLHRPRLLILDEPGTGLDPGARRDLWTYLEEVRQSDGVTILLTTHFMEEADRCDRLAVLHQGVLVALDTPEALKQEVGGDVIIIESRDPEWVLDTIQKKFSLEAAIVGGLVRVSCPRGHEWIPQVVPALADRIQAISLKKPTIEDVFIRKTGQEFYEPA